MRASLSAFVLLALAGCGSSDNRGVVTGTLLKGGKPYTFDAVGLPPGDKGIVIVFESVGGTPTSNGASFDPKAGTFKVPGPKGKGLAAGSYRISIHRGAHGSPDEFKGAFGKKDSPLKAELPGKPVDLTIDLDAKTVKAN